MKPKRTRRVVTTTTLAAEPSGISTGQPAGIQRVPENDDIDAAIAELSGSGAKAHLSRLDEGRGVMVRLCTLDAHQVSQEFVQANFGGGRYSIRFRRGDGSLDKLKMLEIDRRIPAKLPSWVLGNDTPAAPVAPAIAKPRGDEDDQDMRSLLRVQVVEMIKDSNEMRATSSAALMTMLQSVTATIKSMTDSTAALVASITKGGNQSPSISPMDMIKVQADARRETLELVKELRGGNSEAGTIDRAIGLMSKIRAISDDFPGAGGGEKGSAFDSILADLAKAVLPALAGGLAARPAVSALQPAPLPPALASGNGASPPVASPPPQPVQSVPTPLEIALQSLLEHAAQGDSPHDMAVSVVDMCPMLYRGKLREQVMQADAVEQLIAAVPAFGEYRTWLTECVTAVREQFAEPVDEPEEPEKPGASTNGI